MVAAALLLVVGCAGDDDSDEAETRGEDAGAVDPAERCDLGLNTAEFNEEATLVERLDEHSHAMQAGEVDFTVRQWAEVFVDPALGVSADEVASAIEASPEQTRIILGGVVADTLEPDSWVPLTDPVVCQELADQLQVARDVAARYPTAADAMAAGWAPSTVYVPGKGAHYTNMAHIMDGVFDVNRPEMLMYDDLSDPAAHLMGMAYFVLFDPDGVADDEGFAGASDRWHSHDTNCQDAAGIAIAPTECEAGRGTLVENLDGWMIHAWVVPGCESPWGVFSGTNPRLPVLTEATEIGPGCNSGKTVADPLELDDAGDGPTVR